MPEPYFDEHAEIAETILGRAFEQLKAAGLGEVEALHACIHFGIDAMPGFCCAACLAEEYDAVAEAIEDRIEAIPDTETAQPVGAVH